MRSINVRLARFPIQHSIPSAQLSDHPQVPVASDDPRPFVSPSLLPVESLNPVQSENPDAQSQAEPPKSDFHASRKKPYTTLCNTTPKFNTPDMCNYVSVFSQARLIKYKLKA